MKILTNRIVVVQINAIFFVRKKEEKFKLTNFSKYNLN